ncbi:Fe(3+)-hydroxamate ABC transporter permease FhuB [Brucella sp. BE17]|uniref:Fe(3+)-hydroxamate ABC transporter permease FhuB n=1 Tax=Brucella sp. BE17 TaxID=3142977 RepID=UPI0031BA3424
MRLETLPRAMVGRGMVLIALLMVALMLTAMRIYLNLPAKGAVLQQIIFAHSVLPRLAIALICGAALGLSGALIQRVLRNAIADPSTLGIMAGAQLAMTVATIYAPVLMEVARSPVAFTGGVLSLLIVLGLSWRQNLEPVSVIISGMMFSLIAASLSATIILSNGDYLMSLFIWGSGSLDQTGWGPALSLIARTLITLILAVLLLRPLDLLSLGDSTAKALGMGVTLIRAAVLILAVFLATSISAEVGIIGFIGFVAPNVARMAGARTARQILFSSMAIGALLLLLTDGLVDFVSIFYGTFVPTGAVTAILGGPLLLWLLPNIKSTLQATAALNPRRVSRPGLIILSIAFLALLLIPLALFVSRSPDGWAITQGPLLDTIMPWRWPRLMAAISTGAMLATAGCILQRTLGNPMASPEVLGISSGAGVGLAAVLLLMTAPGKEAQFNGALAGSLIAAAIILTLAARYRFNTERLLLAGIATGSISGAFLTLIMARGGAETMALLSWMSGSTQRVTPQDALLLAFTAIFAMVPIVFMIRWLDIMPLGNARARAIGLNVRFSSLLLILIASALSAASTLFIGPLSFIGLMAPHLARQAGFMRAGWHLSGSIAIGICIMIFADWMARSVAFPYQLPLGLFASMIGGPYLIWSLNRSA